jgi:biopolymer transport protein ExbD
MNSNARGFRRRNARALHEAHAGPNMTPMVDVVMVILIFFMASTAIMGPEWLLRTALARKGPSANSAPAPDSDIRLRIELRRAGTDASLATPTPATPATAPAPDGSLRQTLATLRQRIGPSETILGQPDTPFENLRPALGQLAQRVGGTNLIILIAPDDTIPYDQIVQLHEWCADLRIERVGLAP